MLTLINTKQKLNHYKNQFVASMTSLKFEYIDLVKLNTELYKKNKDLLEKTHQLDSCNLFLISENLKLSVIAKDKHKSKRMNLE